MRTVLVGLGCGGWAQLTGEAREALEGAEEIYLRTRAHPALASLPAHIRVRSLDRSLAGGRWEEAMERLLRAARRPQGLVYATPGHPLVGEAIGERLQARCREEAIPFRAIPGVGLAEAALSQVGLKGPFQVGDALSLAPDPSHPLLLCHLRPGLLPRLKARLMESYPSQHQASLISLGADGQGKVQSLPLSDLGRLSPGLHCLYLPAAIGFEALTGLIARLRGPGGCPWDQEQTHHSLKPFLIEEAYEVMEALDEADSAHLKEELGDLLLQIVLHAQMAREEGEFSIGDVIQAISDKLVRRHPHVFGGAQAEGAKEVIARWESLKQEEREPGTSILAGIPQQMPALAYSQALQRRAARAGFEWGDGGAILDKVAEEVREIEAAASQEERLREFGDLLFALADAARWLEVDLEAALHQANERFYRRFRYMEEACQRREVELGSLTLEGWGRLWQEAKAAQGSGS